MLAIVSWGAYYTSPQQVLWVFPAPYPDMWGPFSSRNHFAQFLELILPITLWFALRPSANPRLAGELPRWAFGTASAIILSAGAASASRAGVGLLVLETWVIWVLMRLSAIPGPHRPSPTKLTGRVNTLSAFYWSKKGIGTATVVAATACLVVLAGGQNLIGRFLDPDPLAYRTQIFASALDLIRKHPLGGSGLGTFALAYTEFARFDAGRAVEHAHNDWLEFAATGGIGFALVWIAAGLTAARPAIHSIWAIGILAVCFHALVDDPFARTGVAGWVFMLAGVLMASSGSSGVQFRQSRIP
ncbi:MAG: O-antigen ligase family protein [Acidobacteriota bacterium]